MKTFTAIKRDNKRIFLGGTCANTTWREELIPELTKIGFNYFNPVVDDWTPEAQKNEEYEKENSCKIHLYVITKEMKGVFSIAEVIDSVYQPGIKTILQVIPEGFDSFQIKSLDATINLVNKRGGIAFSSNDFKNLVDILSKF